MINYNAALLVGIVADGLADGGKIVQILRGGANPSPLAPPIDQCGGGAYLAAMVSNRVGFHFMRRDSATGLWSHKNGGGNSEVETSGHKAPMGANRLGRDEAINDDVAVQLLLCANAAYYGFHGFAFAGYVLVPHDGIAVAGLP